LFSDIEQCSQVGPSQSNPRASTSFGGSNTCRLGCTKPFRSSMFQWQLPSEAKLIQNLHMATLTRKFPSLQGFKLSFVASFSGAGFGFVLSSGCSLSSFSCSSAFLSSICKYFSHLCTVQSLEAVTFDEKQYKGYKATKYCDCSLLPISLPHE